MKPTPKRWRVDIRAELDVDTITRVARDVSPLDLGTGATHGLLLHEVRIGRGHTQILASASDAGVKGVANRLKAHTRAKVTVAAARTAARR